VGALWVDGKFYFTSGAGTRKSRNLAENPDCVISMSLPGFDLVVEGTAARPIDEATVQRLAERHAAREWPVRVNGGSFIAEFSAERRPAAVGPLRGHARHGVRCGDGRTLRRYTLAL
jgi:hypothetical protein